MRNKTIVAIIIVGVFVLGLATMRVWDHRQAARQAEAVHASQVQAEADAERKAEAQEQANAKKQEVEANRTKAGVPANAALTEQCSVTNPTTKKTSVIVGDCSEFQY